MNIEYEFRISSQEMSICTWYNMFYLLNTKWLGIAVSVIDKKIRNTEFILNIRKMNKLWKNEKLKGKSFMESTIS